MKKLLATALLAFLANPIFAQTGPASAPDQDHTRAAAVPCAGAAGAKSENSQSRNDGAVIMPCGAAAASAAASGSLTPVYIGAGVVATGVVAAAMSGGGSGHGNDQGPGGNTGGTTGTTGTK